MTRHVNLGFDPDALERMVNAFALKTVQSADDLVGLPTKAVETLDMLQKSQLKVGGDFGVEPKTIKAVNHLVRNVVLTMMATALFIGACVLCSAGANMAKDALVNAGYAFGTVGFLLMIHIFLVVRND